MTIDRASYAVIPLTGLDDRIRHAVRLIKDDGTIYDAVETAHGPECDCADFIFRRDGIDPDGCKHLKALIRHGLLAGR